MSIYNEFLSLVFAARSSAYAYIFSVPNFYSRIFIRGPKKIKNSNGEISEPCGTPFIIGKNYYPSIEALEVLRMRDTIRSVVCSHFRLVSLFMRI